ncbi:MAG: Asp-tRNA(Asn)/Glu-tRNA(Gln) amidotransferase subunit GatC [Chloroflexi bacterium]|nr:Asp-tRNA(Asn)/Glu-tRNA(Gln) amidotransferase subunit GatC [Chloroflexota bacterium]
MNLTIQEVERIADLARLHLTDEEKERFREQLSSILGHVAKLQDLDTAEIQPLTSMSLECTRLREDQPGESLSPEELLNNAPDAIKQQFRVPPVLDTDNHS